MNNVSPPIKTPFVILRALSRHVEKDSNIDGPITFTSLWFSSISNFPA